ncbi:MAG: radical SAM protein, partial [Candidatus Nezhaarchaeota archaeon]|nr:radical SAM protein [Candidatus Nezhaarchaeota archaeon]
MAGLSKKLRSPVCFSEVALVGVEVTDRCNARCGHCYRGALSVPYDVPVEAIVSRVSALPERPEVASYLGGEPLLRRDLADVVKRVGLPAIIFTNGWPLVEAAGALSSIGEPPVMVYVSLEYPDRRQDEHRSLPGLIGRVKEGLRALRDAGVETRVMATLMRGNANRADVEKLVEFAVSYCENEANDLIAFHRYMPSSASDPLSPSPEQLSSAFQAVEDACSQYGLAVHVDDPLYLKRRCGLRRYYV